MYILILHILKKLKKPHLEAGCMVSNAASRSMQKLKKPHLAAVCWLLWNVKPTRGFSLLYKKNKACMVSGYYKADYDVTDHDTQRSTIGHMFHFDSTTISGNIYTSSLS